VNIGLDRRCSGEGVHTDQVGELLLRRVAAEFFLGDAEADSPQNYTPLNALGIQLGTR
jgi:hypothetical protein